MPVRKSQPSADLARCTYLVWGTVKCGKSTFASRFPGACFLATEDGMKGIECNRWEAADGRYVIQSWPELLEATKEVLSSTPRPSMIVLDTADNAYFLLEQHMCQKYGVEFKNDDALAFGKGTAIINGEWRRYLLHLSGQGVGIILTSHTAPQEKDTKKGHLTIDRPSLPDKVLPLVLGMVDFVFYCTTETFKKDAGSEPITRHIMYTRPAPTHVAGHRIGNLPEVLPLKYREFVREFDAGIARQTAARAATAPVPAASAAPTAPAPAEAPPAAAPPTTPAAAAKPTTTKPPKNGKGATLEMPDGSVIPLGAGAGAPPAPTTASAPAAAKE